MGPVVAGLPRSGTYISEGQRMRQLALAIDYLVWMPLAVVVSLFVAVFGYGFAVNVVEPFPREAAIMLTTLLLIAWPAWVLRLAWGVGNEAPPAVRIAIGLAFAVPTTVLLVFVLNAINGCNAGGGFPLGGEECPFS